MSLRHDLARCILAIAALLTVTTAPVLASEPVRSGYAPAHDGSKTYFEVHGSGRRFLIFGFQLQPGSPDVQKFVDTLGRDYRLVLAEIPAKPAEAKLYTLTPAAVARDYLSVADAAGAQDFAFYGYSWGAACGLQLALRTDRVKALISGGFPMMDGPYLQLLEVNRKPVLESPSPPDSQKGSWEMSRQFLTFFEGLQRFDDSKIQNRLAMPRLNFVGTEDTSTFPGVNFYRLYVAHKDRLKAAGWDVLDVQGADHVAAMSPEVSIPVIRKWLNENWRN